jgi:hypothetical protein
VISQALPPGAYRRAAAETSTDESIAAPVICHNYNYRHCSHVADPSQQNRGAGGSGGTQNCGLSVPCNWYRMIAIAWCDARAAITDDSSREISYENRN